MLGGFVLRVLSELGEEVVERGALLGEYFLLALLFDFLFFDDLVELLFDFLLPFFFYFVL